MQAFQMAMQFYYPIAHQAARHATKATLLPASRFQRRTGIATKPGITQTAIGKEQDRRAQAQALLQAALQSAHLQRAPQEA